MLCTTALLAAALLCADGPTLTVRGLIQQATDLEGLTRMPVYTSRQASSYDRASKVPGNPEWFANGDAGQFLRIEDKADRREFVLAELEGPGSIVRFWSANPAGILRFYFDGEREPTFSWPLADYLSGKVAPMGDPWAYTAAAGWNNYYPVPYAKSLKVTVDDSGGGGARNLYYQIGYRTYPKGTGIRSLTQQGLEGSAVQAAHTGRSMLEPLGLSHSMKSGVAAAKGRITLYQGKGSGAITMLAVRPQSRDGQMRRLRLQASFDGEPCIDTPLGDFFGAGAGQSAYRSLPFEVREDGWMVCRFWMPYRNEAIVRIYNDRDEAESIEYEVRTAPYSWDGASMHFKAQWLSDRLFTRPFTDMPFLHTDGPGMWVGTSLHVSNPVSMWWGEGDEKVFVDGESFPSTFGTGTEDFFGYAWCSPEKFWRPFHAQPRCDGPGNYGNTMVSRWQIADPIPFRKSIRFDIELWHWSETTVTYARTAYWYAKPGTAGPKTRYPARILPPGLAHPEEPEGAVQGENLVWKATGGVVEIQRGISDTSGAAHLWWRDAQVNDTLTLETAVPNKGRYRLDLRYLVAPDYGIFRLKVNGAPYPWPFDFYHPGIEVRARPYGVWNLEGKVTLEWQCLGSNAKADPRHMLGLDTLRWVRVP